MRPKHRGISRSITILLTLYLWTRVAADAQQLPRSLTIGANPPGTVFYALASGLAKFASEGAPFQMTVQPYTGTSTFLPLLNTGEIDFGINNAVDMALAYQGPDRLKIGGRNPFQHRLYARIRRLKPSTISAARGSQANIRRSLPTGTTCSVIYLARE